MEISGDSAATPEKAQFYYWQAAHNYEYAISFLTEGQTKTYAQTVGRAFKMWVSSDDPLRAMASALRITQDPRAPAWIKRELLESMQCMNTST